jgi:hypothetical protein
VLRRNGHGNGEAYEATFWAIPEQLKDPSEEDEEDELKPQGPKTDAGTVDAA